ncbi:MAG: ABC transporter permease [Clostridiales bacterium]|nr:ABC transporter permease [Clostridiales bacterium]
MLKYCLRRILMMIPVLISVVIVIFTLLYFAKGDPVELILGAEATPDQIQETREELGLNDSYIVRLGRYFKQLLVDHNLGNSYRTGRSVSSDLVSKFWVTMSVAFGSIIFAIVFGLLMGVLAATHQDTIWDTLSVSLALIGSSMPGFLVALLLSLLFALKLGWLEASGWGGFKYMILPIVSYGISHATTIARQTRSSMLEVIRQDYIVTARAKGVSNFKVIYVHALRNALIPIITQIGMMFATAVGGAVVTETIFSIPGIGTYMLTAIKSRDYPVVQGGMLLVAFGFGIVMLLVDIVYAFVDPRIGSKYKTGKKKKAVPKAVEE